MTFSERLPGAQTLLADLWQNLRRFPWRNTALTLRERFREDRLGVTASSLTFTTTISLVPLFTVALAIFSAFPMFARLQTTLQRWLVESLVPDNIAKQVLSYLNQFAAKAGQIGWVGALFLLVTALALILTIDRKLNDIWRVRTPRPLAQRIMVYWAALTLGPLVLAASLAGTSYVLAATNGVVRNGSFSLLLDSLQFVLMITGMAALYRFVPNTRVRWPHALVGGLFTASALEIAKSVLVWYLGKVPTYSLVYGTFATVPILLVWFYVAWVIVLLGAVVVAYLPSLLSGIVRRGNSPGWRFQLALESLALLQSVRQTDARGMSLEALAQTLKVEPLHLEEPIGAMVALDWLGRLDEEEARYVLLLDPSHLPVAPLAQRLLLPDVPSTAAFWSVCRLRDLRVDQVLNG